MSSKKRTFGAFASDAEIFASDAAAAAAASPAAHPLSLLDAVKLMPKAVMKTHLLPYLTVDWPTPSDVAQLLHALMTSKLTSVSISGEDFGEWVITTPEHVYMRLLREGFADRIILEHPASFFAPAAAIARLRAVHGMRVANGASRITTKPQNFTRYIPDVLKAAMLPNVPFTLRYKSKLSGDPKLPVTFADPTVPACAHLFDVLDATCVDQTRYNSVNLADLQAILSQDLPGVRLFTVFAGSARFSVNSESKVIRRQSAFEYTTYAVLTFSYMGLPDAYRTEYEAALAAAGLPLERDIQNPRTGPAHVLRGLVLDVVRRLHARDRVCFDLIVEFHLAMSNSLRAPATELRNSVALSMMAAQAGMSDAQLMEYFSRPVRDVFAARAEALGWTPDQAAVMRAFADGI